MGICPSLEITTKNQNFPENLDRATGVQQGDPLGPALFALAIHRVTSKVKSDLNVWYLDDGCIGGDTQTVLSNAAINHHLEWTILSWPQNK